MMAAAPAPLRPAEAPLSRLIADFVSNPVAVFGVALLALIVVVAIAAPFISPQNPYDLAQLDVLDGRLPPGSTSATGATFWLGTDDQGRDMLSAIMFGARVSLLVGLASVAFALVLGVSLGLIAGYVGGKVDAFIMRVADVQFSSSDANLGDTAGALASLDEARRILERRLAREPGDVTALRLLARAHLSTADLQLYLRNRTQARASVESGLRLRERLAASGDAADRRELAGAYHRLADVLTLDDQAASLVPRRRALEMFEVLLAARPDDDDARRSVARASKTLGSTLNDLHRYTEAEAYYARALAIDEGRVAALPRSSQAQLDLSLDLSLLATLRMNYDDPRGALTFWGRTIAVRKALVDADPKDARARGRLAFAYLRSSYVRAVLGDFDGGLADANEALSHADTLVAANPDDAIGRSYTAQAWLRIGRNEAGLAGRATAGARASHRSRACTACRQSLQWYEPLVAAGRASDADRGSVAEVQALLASCPAPPVTARDKAHP
jgi:tetratricopeptide (TPR) repeat protein